MARSIGVLGTVHEPLDLEFVYFGATIRVHPRASDTVELEFLEAGRDIDLTVFDKPVADLPEEEMAAAVGKMGQALARVNLLMRDSLQKLIHPDDFDTYWKLAAENGQLIRDLAADIKRITASVVEADTGFPTTPPSGSPDGQGPTPPRSADDSSSAAEPEPTSAEVATGEVLPPDLVASLALERGRDDIQMVYVMQYLTQRQMEREQADRDRRDREKLAAAGIG